ncbi:MAG: hypothetical protein IPP81_11495 [Chitinophagaceae bacterium]|nr:hypothetical protein [Chitinophagaceae bacterium]
MIASASVFSPMTSGYLFGRFIMQPVGKAACGSGISGMTAYGLGNGSTVG